MRQKAPEQSAVKRELREARKDINRTGIPDNLKEGMEAVSGLSFDDVRVHYSSRKPEKLYANAYTQGNHVYIGPGKESSLPHELGHIIQQKQKRVRPTLYLGRTAINNDQVLEREADRLGAMALRQKTEFLPENTVESMPDGASPVQMAPNAQFGEIILLEPPQEQPQQGRRGRRPPSQEQPKQEPSESSPGYPLMVYETFGNKEDELVNVYLQSCQYPGKTVCILGLNQRYRMSEYAAAPSPDISNLQDQLAGRLKPGHKAYIVPFKWRSVGGRAIE
ncbi:MAG: DUF4157 domain-containing protein, partial [Acetatifactor sp.]|nr:DUF4157 domain-containing protein [Acetatifactor sp.]